jgi:dihydrofolate synthase/folylpolyglutamate synthase
MLKMPVARNLDDWLAYIEGLHPKSIAMGLERVNQVIDRLNLHPSFTIITVAGTNGKGSTCAMLENIYREAGYKVGCYTSPHLVRYNERVKVNGEEVDDETLCEAFTAIDAARAGDVDHPVALTYFEVGTLAAIWHFMQAQVDIAILEIGLGGRLDAVNAFEPDCAIVTSIDLDHMEFLGDTREKIGLEKAGIYRSNLPAICGDHNPPESLLSYAASIQADLKRIDLNFGHQLTEKGWQFINQDQFQYALPLPALQGRYQLDNAACAIAAVESLQSKRAVSVDAMVKAMQTTVAGRFQTISLNPRVILDVAHNPHAARALAENLHACRKSSSKTIAVFAMLGDKDIPGVISAVQQEIDNWYVADIDHPRGAQAQDLKTFIAQIAPSANCLTFNSAAAAYAQACIDVGENDKIVVFGSFFTVSNVMQAFAQRTH